MSLMGTGVPENKCPAGPNIPQSAES